MDDETQCGQPEHERVRGVKRLMQAALEQDRESDAENEEQDREASAAKQRIRDYVNGHEPGDGYEDESVQYLPGNGITPAERIDERTCKECGDTQYQEHRRVG